jgi:hypothetical protein
MATSTARLTQVRRELGGGNGPALQLTTAAARDDQDPGALDLVGGRPAARRAARRPVVRLPRLPRTATARIGGDRGSMTVSASGRENGR